MQKDFEQYLNLYSQIIKQIEAMKKQNAAMFDYVLPSKIPNFKKCVVFLLAKLRNDGYSVIYKKPNIFVFHLSTETKNKNIKNKVIPYDAEIAQIITAAERYTV